MRNAILVAVIAAAGFSSAAYAQGKVVGVSWSNFQEERWKTDEAAIKAALEANGDTYISADAQASAAKQLTDVEALIAQGANALIILAMDKDAIGPAVDKAAAEGIPVVGYDRLIEDSRAFYLTFDNKGVGKIIAETVKAAKPEGNYAIIKGDPGDHTAAFLLERMMDAIGVDVHPRTRVNVAPHTVFGHAPVLGEDSLAVTVEQPYDHREQLPRPPLGGLRRGGDRHEEPVLLRARGVGQGRR